MPLKREVIDPRVTTREVAAGLRVLTEHMRRDRKVSSLYIESLEEVLDRLSTVAALDDEEWDGAA